MTDNKALTLVKTIYCIPVTLVALLAAFPVLQIITALITGNRVFGIEVIITILIVTYIPFCYLSCTKFLKDPALLILGIIMHAMFFIVAFYINLPAYTLAGISFMLFWVILYISRVTLESKTAKVRLFTQRYL